MVITRQQNVTAEANTSMKKFSKEQNDLKMKELQEFAANNAVGQYDLNLHVLGLNNYSTFVEMIKGYCSMARRFYPDNNYGFDTTEMMTMINTSKEGLQDQLHKNDAVREKERAQAAEDEISIPYDHNSDSESSGTSSEPASSSSKESTLPGKHTHDNEHLCCSYFYRSCCHCTDDTCYIKRIKDGNHKTTKCNSRSKTQCDKIQQGKK